MSNTTSHPHGYKVALYPTPFQCTKLEQVFGNVRFVFNKFIQYREWEYEHGYTNKETGRHSYKYVRTILTVDNKRRYPWLKEAPAAALQEACKQAKVAYGNMIAKRAEGEECATPRRKKYGKQSFTLPGKTSFKIRETDAKRHRGHIYIPKVGWVRYHAGKALNDASSVTIIKEKDGSYYASVSLPYTKPTNINDRTSAFDVGLTDLVTGVTSDGMKIILENPRHYKKAEKNLKKQQRRLSRKKKGSSSYVKQKKKLSKAHRYVKNVRDDYLHKFSHDVAVNSHDVTMENLDIEDLKQNSRYAKNISDASWATLMTMIQYKISGTFTQVDRYFPSSKQCSWCHNKVSKLPVSIRKWTCPTCSNILDRDGNAAVNILVTGGHSETLNASGVDVRQLSQPLSMLKLEYFCTMYKKIYGDNHGLKIYTLIKKPHP